MRTFLTSSMILSLLLVPACGGSGGGTGTDSTTDATTDVTTTGMTTTATTADTTTSTTATSPATEPGTTAEPVTTTTTPGTTTTEPGTTTSTTSDTTTTGTTDTTDTDTTDTMDTTDTGTTTTGDPVMCPPAPGDTECDECVKANCCDEVLACAGDEDCACFFDCLGMGGTNPECAGQCMVNPGQVPELAAVGQCVNGSCGQQCP